MTTQSPASEKSIRNLFVKNVMWNTVGTTVYMCCLWMLTIIVVWLYDDYLNAGYFALAMGITGFFYHIALQNTRSYQVSDTDGEYTDSEYVSSRVVASIVSVVLCVIFVFLFDYSAIQRSVVILYMLFRSTEAIIDVMHGIDQKHWRMDFIAISFVIRGILVLAAFSIFGWLFGLVPAIIGMFVVSASVGLLFDLPKSRKLAKFTLSIGKPVFLLIKRSLPLMIASLIGVFLISFTRYSVEEIHGTEALGIYASVAAPSTIMQAMATFVFSPLANVFTAYKADSNRERFVKLFLLVCAGTLGISALFYAAAYFFGHWGLTVLFGESIIPHTYLLPGAVIAAGLTAMIWFMSVIFSITRDISGLLTGSLIGAATAILATNFFLIRFGLEGANHILIASQGAAVLFLSIRFLSTSKRLLGCQSEHS